MPNIAVVCIESRKYKLVQARLSRMGENLKPYDCQHHYPSDLHDTTRMPQPKPQVIFYKLAPFCVSLNPSTYSISRGQVETSISSGLPAGISKGQTSPTSLHPAQYLPMTQNE